jgi:hypothetical protein
MKLRARGKSFEFDTDSPYMLVVIIYTGTSTNASETAERERRRRRWAGGHRLRRNRPVVFDDSTPALLGRMSGVHALHDAVK